MGSASPIPLSPWDGASTPEELAAQAVDQPYLVGSVSRADGLGKARQAIHASNQDILHPSIGELPWALPAPRLGAGSLLAAGWASRGFGIY